VTVRRAFLLAHQWAGLAAAAFLVVIAVSGSALVFENDIDRALNPALSFVPNPEGRLRPLPLEELVARVNAERPDDPVGGVRIADRPDQAYEFSSRLRRSTFVDPYLGRVLGSRDRERSLARRLHLLHTRLLAGGIGEQMVGWFSVALLTLATSGLVLWWPRKIAALRSSPSWKRINFDLHNLLGVYSWLVIVAITLSGVLIAFQGVTDPIVRRLDDRPEAAAPQSTPVPGAKRITLDRAIAIGESALPGAAASNVNVPADRNAVFRILKKFPEDRTPAGRSRVYIDQFSGAVLLVENTRTAALGTRILNLKRSAHTGDIFGAPTQTLYFLVSLGIAMQAITGVLIWWNARVSSSPPRPSRRSKS
jgi:uncharacterized iron-regulated membrane protein